ncbi:MAG: sigma-70 family RNA polymerase sigma factor [Flavobacteriales bacterium]|nr:sigma-70 family RNA polymerase sigma factor [Flavobacteriales bacterium]
MTSEKELQDLLQSPLQREKAFEQLMERVHQKVYYFIRRMVLDHDDASDVTQDVFIKAWKSLSTFRGESLFSTWVMRIAYNESITFINKKKRILGVPLNEVQQHLSEKLEADVHYSGDEIQRKLQTAIASLPEKQKSVFIMRYYDEVPYKEMAEITGTSVGALKASYHHAAQKIEESLKKQDW